MKVKEKIEAQFSSENGHQYHNLGASLANRHGQEINPGNPTYGDIHLSADSVPSYVYTATSSSKLLGTVALLQAKAYSFIKYVKSNKLTQTNNFRNGKKHKLLV